MGKRRRRPRTNAEEKLQKFVKAKTLLGRANYLIDFADEVKPDPLRDEASHFLAEMLLGSGPLMKRMVRWGRKFWKYRSGI